MFGIFSDIFGGLIDMFDMFNMNESFPERRDIKIYLKDKIDEKALKDTLIEIGLISIEITKSHFLFETYYKFSLKDKISPINNCYQDFFIGCSIKLDAEKSCIRIYGYNENENVISGMKKILFKEKILDEVYDKAEEYKNNIEEYEANTDDIIERIEEIRIHFSEEKEQEIEVKPYDLFIIKHFIKFLMDKYKEELSLSENNSQNEEEKEEVKEQNKELNIEKLNPIIKQCENKINEIKEIIKDFDYSDKKTYEEATSKIEKDLEELENKDISVSRVNEIIDEINETYRNAYKKKNNVSALSYIMETDEDIDLIKKIDIDNL